MDATLSGFSGGETVSAYPKSNWLYHELPASGAPKGAAAAQGVADASGRVTLNGLAEGTDYYARGGTSGKYVSHKSRTTLAGSAIPGLKSFGGLQPVCSSVVPNSLTPGTGVDTTAFAAVMSRIPLDPVDDLFGIQFWFGNWCTNLTGTDTADLDNANPVTVSVSLELVKNGNTSVIQLWKRKVLQPGESACTPMVNPRFVKGVDQMFLRTYQECATNLESTIGGNLVGSLGVTPESAFYKWSQWTVLGTPVQAAAVADVTGASGALAGTGATLTAGLRNGYQPFLITGIRRNPSKYIVAALHDSLGVGKLDPSATVYGQGYLRRMLEQFGIPLIRLGRDSEALRDENPAAGVSALRSGRRRPMLVGCTHVINEKGINDLSLGGRTLAQLAADDDALNAELKAMGLVNLRCTLGPNTTLAGQPIADRAAFNDRLRAGVANVDAVLDVADQVESARNSNAFKAGYNGDTVHLSTVGATAVATGLQPQLAAIFR